jgi:hypothetical protein
MYFLTIRSACSKCDTIIHVPFQFGLLMFGERLLARSVFASAPFVRQHMRRKG